MADSKAFLPLVKTSQKLPDSLSRLGVSKVRPAGWRAYLLYQNCWWLSSQHSQKDVKRLETLFCICKENRLCSSQLLKERA